MSYILVKMLKHPDGKTVCKTLKEEIYHTSYEVYDVPAGFESDGASLPRFFWRLIGHPFSMDYLREAILHDYFYRTQYIPRKKADKIFLELLKKKMPFRCYVIYYALRAFGWIAWTINKKKYAEKNDFKKGGLQANDRT